MAFRMGGGIYGMSLTATEPGFRVLDWIELEWDLMNKASL